MLLTGVEMGWDGRMVEEKAPRLDLAATQICGRVGEPGTLKLPPRQLWALPHADLARPLGICL